MLAELNEAKNFLIDKFGSVEKVEPGTYAIPTETSKGKAFMRVLINQNMGISGFNLFLDDKFEKEWKNSKINWQKNELLSEISVHDKIYCISGIDAEGVEYEAIGNYSLGELESIEDIEIKQ